MSGIIGVLNELKQAYETNTLITPALARVYYDEIWRDLKLRAAPNATPSDGPENIAQQLKAKIAATIPGLEKSFNDGNDR
jgi:hypothetical protein